MPGNGLSRRALKAGCGPAEAPIVADGPGEKPEGTLLRLFSFVGVADKAL